MRIALLVILCVLPVIAAADEQKPASGAAIKVALAPSSGAPPSLSTEPVESGVCVAEMDSQSLRDLVQTQARSAGIDEKLALAILDQESTSGVNLNSRRGARGPMMLMPQTAAQYGVKDICNPVENVRGSMRFLKDLVVQFQGNMMLVAAAYNAGSERVYQAKGVPANLETVRYVAAVTNQYYGLGDFSARRGKRGPEASRNAQEASEGETPPAGKSRSARDQQWIGGSVLYVAPDDEGESK
ncbi:lytic transglycosylase domain-containing protein [Methylocystis sp. ATCC 49242]|jgi:soluble lytic murein transglycosylase-like protein|uniref:lytic transglycosylase domain-containing protein n=1 Tax=Methylocystis sp. ATCC 49242 TaxID=622637 RepID=UPI001FCACEA3|nr:lytic transglycosylase domain-containing protein [Methylocystis sp. ATCC 49242]